MPWADLEADLASVGTAPASTAAGVALAPPVDPDTIHGEQHPDKPTPFIGGGGMLPNGAVAADPAVWARWLSEYNAPNGTPNTGPGETSGAATAKGDISAPAVAPQNQWSDLENDLALSPAQISEALKDKNFPVAPGQITGVLPNFAAGMSRQVYGLAGLPVDAMTGLVNVGARALGLPEIKQPVGGSEWLNKTNASTGLIPDVNNVVPAGQGERLAGAAGGGLAGVLIPGAAARGAVSAGVALGRPLIGAVLDALGAGMAPSGAAMGATGGITGEMARESVPPAWQPLAEAGGNVVGGGLTAASEGLLRSGSRIAGKAIGGIAAPFNLGSVETPINPTTGSAFINPATGAPVTMTDQMARNAAAGIGKAANMPISDLAASIPEPNPNSIGQPTLGQVTGNLGVLGQERALKNLNRVPFNARDAQNNVDRAKALVGLADPDASHAAASDFVQQQLRQINGMTDAEARALAAAKASRDGLPATPVATTGADIGAHVQAAALPGQQAAEGALKTAQGALDQSTAIAGLNTTDRLAPVGAAVRRPLSVLDQMKNDRVNALYDIIDPNKKLIVDGSQIADAGRSLNAEFESRPLLTRPNADVAAFIDKAQNVGPSMPFQDLRDLRSGITTQISVEKADPGGRPAIRQLTQILQAIDNTMGEVAGARAAEDAAAVKAGTMKPEDTVGAQLAQDAGDHPSASNTIPKVGNKVYTPDGTEIPVKYRLIEGKDLITSHDSDMRVNKSYPQSYQPRIIEDSKTAAIKQHQIETKFTPELVGASSTTSSGAPIVDNHGVVIVGNNRANAALAVQQKGMPAGVTYRQKLKEWGFDTTGFEHPVLVRQIEGDMSIPDKVKLGKSGNANPQGAMSSVERAQIDAGNMGDDVMGKYKGGAVDSAANVPFARAFAEHALGFGEEGNFATGAGELSLEGKTRLQNALLHKAYGDADLTRLMTETGDKDISAFGGAMTDAAGDMARLSADIDAGRVLPDMAIGKNLAQAARVIVEARKRGITIGNVLDQTDAFRQIEPMTRSLLEAAYGANLSGRMNVTRFAGVLRDFAQEARAQGVQDGLFGQAKSAAELLQEAEAKNGTTGKSTNAMPSGAGAGDGKMGTSQRGPGNGEVGPQGSQSGIGGASTDAMQSVVPSPSPNLTDADVAKYRLANGEFAEGRDLYHEGAVGDVLQARPRNSSLFGQFSLADEDVPAKLFHGGSSSSRDINQLQQSLGGATHDDAMAFATKLATDPATGAVNHDLVGQAMSARADGLASIERYAALDLRNAAMQDGKFNVAKAQKWMADHEAALDAFPELRAKFQNVTDLQNRVATLQAQRDALIDSYPLLKATSDTAAARQYLKPGPQGGEAVRAYLKDTGGTPAAMATIQDGLLSSMRDACMRDGQWSTAAYNKWSHDWAPALAELPGLKTKIGDIGGAQNAAADFQARRMSQLKDFQDSALSHYVTKTGDAVDPKVAMESVMRSPTAPADMRDLVSSMKGDDAAMAGLRRGVLDWIDQQITGASESGTSGVRAQKQATFKGLLQDPKVMRTLKEVYTPDQLDVLNRIGNSMDLEARSTNATAIKGSPGTAADLHASGDHTEGANSLMQLLIGEYAGEAAAHVVGGGGLLGLVGKVGGAVAAQLYNLKRAAGIATKNDAMAMMVLHPELFRIAAQKAPIAADSPIWSTLGKRLLAATSAEIATSRNNRKGLPPQ